MFTNNWLLAIFPDDGTQTLTACQLPVTTSRQLPKTKNVNEYVKVLHGHLCDAIHATRISADQEAARHKRLYD